MTKKKSPKAEAKKAPREVAKCACGAEMLDGGKGLDLYCPRGFACSAFRKSLKASAAEAKEAKADFLESLQNQAEVIAELNTEIAKLKDELAELSERALPAGWTITSAETPVAAERTPERGGFTHNVLLNAFSWWFRDARGVCWRGESDSLSVAVGEVMKHKEKSAKKPAPEKKAPSKKPAPKKGGKS